MHYTSRCFGQGSHGPTLWSTMVLFGFGWPNLEVCGPLPFAIWFNLILLLSLLNLLSFLHVWFSDLFIFPSLHSHGKVVFAWFCLSLVSVFFYYINIHICVIYFYFCLGKYRVNCYLLMCFVCWDIQRIAKKKSLT